MSGYGNASRNYLESLSKIKEINLKCINFSFESREFKCDLVNKHTLVDLNNIKRGKFLNDDVKAIFEYLDSNQYDVIFFLPNDWLGFGANTEAFLFNDSINLHKICKGAVNVYPCVVWETDKVPSCWLESYKRLSNIKKLICACEWNKSVFGQEVKKECITIPYLVKNNLSYDSSFYKKITDMQKGRFTFCNISQWNDRKGMEEMIRSFYCEFWNDDVVLILKTYIDWFQVGTNSRELLLNKISRIKKSIKHYGKSVNFKCNIILIDSILTKEEINSIYKASDAYVTCTKGEGFGLPIAEFLIQNNKPVVIPDKGGHLDFCGNSNLFIRSEYEPCGVSQNNHYSEIEMKSIQVSLTSAQEKMRQAVEINKTIDFSSKCVDYLNEDRIIKLFKEALEI